MQAHSQELRHQVLRAVDEGMPRDEIIERFHISRATTKRYLKQRRETGDVLRRPIPGRPKVKGMALQTQLAHQLTANPGATLADHCQIWEAEQGMRVSESDHETGDAGDGMEMNLHVLSALRTSRKGTVDVPVPLPQVSTEAVGAAQTTLSNSATAAPRVPTMLAPSVELPARIPVVALVLSRSFFFPVPID